MADKGKKEKKELSDLRDVPFTGSLFWEDLDKDFLIRLMLVWQRAIKELSFNGFIPEITKRFGWEAAMEINERAGEHYARVTMPLLAEAANVQAKTLADAHKVVLLMPDSSGKSRKASKEKDRNSTIDSHQKIVNENHIKAWTDWCIYADAVYEQVGTQPEIADKLLHQVCAEFDMRMYKFYLEQVLPGKKIEIKLTKVPTVKSRGEKPVCTMECVLKE